MGAILFAGFALYYLVLDWEKFPLVIYLAISGQLFLVGGLFLINCVYKTDTFSSITGSSKQQIGSIFCEHRMYSKKDKQPIMASNRKLSNFDKSKNMPGIFTPPKLIASLLLSIFILLIASCSNQEKGKIPITTKSKQALAYYLQGRELSENLRGQDAVRFFQQAIALDSNFALAYLGLAMVQPSTREFLEVFNTAKTYTDLISVGERLMIYGIDADASGLQMQQCKMYRDLVDIYPSDERAHYLLGNHFFGNQEYPAAIKAYHKAIVINSNFAPSYNQLGYAHRSLGEYGQAKTAFRKYLQLIPNDPNPLDSYAELLLKIGKFETSLEQYYQALELDPHFVPSHIGIATNLNLLGRHEEAREQLLVLYENARNSREMRAAHFATAVSYVDEGRFVDALSELDKQYDLAKKINDVIGMVGDLVAMGNVLLEMEATAEATEKFQQAKDITETSDLAENVKNNNRRFYPYFAGLIAVANHDFKTAREYADQFIEKIILVENPREQRLSHELSGIIALAEGDFDSAISELNLADQQNPYNLYRLALAYIGKGETDKYDKYLKMALDYNAVNSLNFAFIRYKHNS